MINDEVMIIFGIGCVGRYDNGPDRHDGQIGDCPFRSVFRGNKNAVSGAYTCVNKNAGKPPYLIGNSVPAAPAPFATVFFK